MALQKQNMESVKRYTAQKYNDNLGHDPKHVLDGMLVLKSEFCEVSHAPIESHMRQGF